MSRCTAMLVVLGLGVGCKGNGSSPASSTVATSASTTGSGASSNDSSVTAATSSGAVDTARGSGSTGSSPCVSGRSEQDRPDDSDAPQVHVVYAVPSDGEDRQYDLDGTLATSVAVFDAWFATQTRGTALRLDTCDGELDVTFFALAQTDAEIAEQGAFVRDHLEEQLAAAGRLQDHKLYAVYYDGTSTFACGGGAWPPTLIGRVAAMYLRGLPPDAAPCPQAFAGQGDPPGYLEHAMLHEIVHTLGLAGACAPHSDGFGHTDDVPEDLMYAGPMPWDPSVLDPGNDDYWQHRIAGCPDLADSALLEPMPADPQLPPGW